MVWYKRLLSLAVHVVLIAVPLAVATPHAAFAVPASPEIHQFEQPDGTKFNARQWGDENGHGWENEDGYTIIFESMMNSWTYAREDSRGNLVGSSFIAGKDMPPADLKTGLRPKRPPKSVMKMTTKEKNFAARSSSSSGVLVPHSPSAPQMAVPATGSGKIPILLTNFNDTTATYTSGQFNNLIFSSGMGKHSMNDYYQEVSYGAFAISPGSLGGVVSWSTSKYGHDYYGANAVFCYQGYTYWINPNCPSEYTLGVQDKHPGDLVRDAVAAADTTIDYSEFDQDGDCYVDVVAVIHQGTGEETGVSAADIWSHRWSLQGASDLASQFGYADGGVYTTNDACPGHPGEYMKVNDYIVMPEKQGSGITTVGVLAHEYGHSLGLPDLYDTDYFSNGVGRWSLMAAGEWNYVTRSGDRPAHMDAWSKYALGWVTPAQVTGVLSNEPINAASTTANVYQLLSGGPGLDTGEYYLVENRQQIGFDAGLPGTGLLIWHIDESQSSTSDDCASFPFNYLGSWYWFNENDLIGNPNCSSTAHYHVSLVQADNRYQLERGDCYVSGGALYCNGNTGDSGDPFPGSTLNMAFTGTSNAVNNTNLYEGNLSNLTPSNVQVVAIGNSGPVMTASMTALANLPFVPLEEALDNPEIESEPLLFTGTWVGQGLYSYYPYTHGSAAQSAVITSGQNSSLSTIVPARPGGSTLSFFWKVSSKPTYDYLKFLIDGVEKARISGSVEWQQMYFTLAAGTPHTLTWIYVKNGGSVSKRVDAGWVDKVEISPFTALQLAAPNGGELLHPGDTQPITWNAHAQAERYKLYYTLDNGTTWKLIQTVTSQAFTNTYNWTVPMTPGNQTLCRVKVVGLDAANAIVGSAKSSGPFTIEGLKVNSPNGNQILDAGSNVNIEYTMWGLSTAHHLKFFFSVDGGVSWPYVTRDENAADFADGQHSYQVTVPVPSGNRTACRVKVVAYNSANLIIGSDASDSNFTIESLQVISPNGGEILSAGTTTDITYTMSGLSTAHHLKFFFSVDGGVSWPYVTRDENAADFADGQHSYQVTVPVPSGSKTACRVKIVAFDAVNANIGSDISNASFTIAIIN